MVQSRLSCMRICTSLVTDCKARETTCSSHDYALTEAAALILLKALDYSRPDEAWLAADLMMLYYPDNIISKVRQAFLMGMCEATDMCAVLRGLRTYSEQADQQQ